MEATVEGTSFGTHSQDYITNLQSFATDFAGTVRPSNSTKMILTTYFQQSDAWSYVICHPLDLRLVLYSKFVAEKQGAAGN